MKQYEAMFLFDPTFGSTFEACETEIRRIFDRSGAKALFCRKWDERRLAFRVDGRKRGVYVLVYFNVETDKIGSIERDSRLSEGVLRVLILQAEGVTPEMMERAVTMQHSAESEGQEGGRFDKSKQSGSERAPAAGAGEAANKKESESKPVAEVSENAAPAE